MAKIDAKVRAPRRQVVNVIARLSGRVKTVREILRGVLRYSYEHSSWVVQIVDNTDTVFHFMEQDIPVTGFIGTTDLRLVSMLHKRGIPAIALDYDEDAIDDKRGINGVVRCFNPPIATMAAEYLLGLGATSFAAVGDRVPVCWSTERLAVFAERIGKAGFKVAVHTGTKNDPPLERFLSALPAGTAVFAVNDRRARDILDICTRLGIAVPEHFMLLSCDNDELICETSHPTLSSIQFTTERAGYEAAELLDRLMNQSRVAKSSRVVTYSAAEVVMRESTQHADRDNSIAARAASLIRLNASMPFKVNDLVEQLHVSRRHLEIAFRRATGRTLHDEIMRVRLARAAKLLASTADPIEKIAADCGFSCTSHLGMAFRRAYSVTPGTYRRTHRAK